MHEKKITNNISEILSKRVRLGIKYRGFPMALDGILVAQSE